MTCRSSIANNSLGNEGSLQSFNTWVGILREMACITAVSEAGKPISLRHQLTGTADAATERRSDPYVREKG